MIQLKDLTLGYEQRTLLEKVSAQQIKAVHHVIFQVQQQPA